MVQIGNKDKSDIITDFQIHKTDTGSTEVQIAILTTRINHLTAHLKKHKKDVHSRRGLLILVGRRSRLKKYLVSKDEKKYKALATKLKLKN